MVRLGAGELQQRGARGTQRPEIQRVRRRHVPPRLHQLLRVPPPRLAPRHRLLPLQPRLAQPHRRRRRREVEMDGWIEMSSPRPVGVRSFARVLPVTHTRQWRSKNREREGHEISGSVHALFLGRIQRSPNCPSPRRARADASEGSVGNPLLHPNGRACSASVAGSVRVGTGTALERGFARVFAAFFWAWAARRGAARHSSDHRGGLVSLARCCF